MLHLSSWMTTLPMMFIGMVGIILVIGVNGVGKTTILDAIQKSGAAISHHHGIGKMFAPWLEGYIGEKEYGVFRVLKDYFDPDYTMNPGGTIGLDLKPEEKKRLNERKDYR